MSAAIKPKAPTSVPTPEPTPHLEAAPAPAAEPDVAQAPEAIEVVEAKAFSLEDAINVLIETLGLDEREVASISINPQGSVRFTTIDNATRGRKFTPLARFKRDRDGYIIRDEEAL